jgi:hypothetical protein
MRWAGHVACIGEGRNVYRVFMGKPEGKRPLRRPQRRWEDGIKMNLREIGWGSVKLIHLAQDMDRWRALVYAVMTLQVLAPCNWLVSLWHYKKGQCLKQHFNWNFIQHV